MIGKKIVHTEPLSCFEAAELVSKIEEPDFVQRQVMEHVEKIGKLENAGEIREKLKEIVDPELAAEIVNVRPKTKEDLLVIFYKRREVPPEDAYDKILELFR